MKNENLLKSEIRFKCKERCPEMCNQVENKFEYYDSINEDDEWVVDDNTMETICHGRYTKLIDNYLFVFNNYIYIDIFYMRIKSYFFIVRNITTGTSESDLDFIMDNPEIYFSIAGFIVLALLVLLVSLVIGWRKRSRKRQSMKSFQGITSQN